MGIADSRVTSGNKIITAQKVTCFENGEGAFFLMTSGLRSVRDKALTYFEELWDDKSVDFSRLYRVANSLADQIRKVAAEDRESLAQSGLTFNIHVLVGGQMSGDKEHKLYLIYPEGNWVEIAPGTPYHIIGEGGYGKPVLDRTLKYDDSIHFALKVGCLAFDSTRISASDVDFPLDVVVFAKGAKEIAEHRYEAEDLSDISTWWQERLRQSVNELPSEWIDNIAQKLTAVRSGKRNPAPAKHVR